MSELFTRETKAIFWNNNRVAIQRMLDYDFLIQRKTPSIAAIVHAASNYNFEKVFYGANEILIPIYRSLYEAAKNHSDVEVLLNFGSLRSASAVTLEALDFDHIKTIMVTAEGIPERITREVNLKAKQAGKLVIGPSTVGAITPGAFKTANIGGSTDNILNSKLHRAGSAGLVTRSGGLFNEFGSILALHGDGIAEGVAIGGDRYPGTVFIDHLLRMEANPRIKYLVVLGEVGGVEEYKIIEAIGNGQITKPVIGWCIGTIAKHFESGIQFGHASASANTRNETATAKNQAMKAGGILVPDSFNDLPILIKQVYDDLCGQGLIEEVIDPSVPIMLEDFSASMQDRPIRRAKGFVSTISDDRGEEATYAGIPISALATPETGYGIGDVITLLWFKKRYPKWAVDFIETVIKTVADHGPAVSGAHNAKVTARAGKDVVSSLVTGLLTIGPRFGGALDGAARYFKYANECSMTAQEFVSYMNKEGILIPGIGHRIKSLRNPDLRVSGLKEYAAEFFPATPMLDFSLEVEKITTAKKDNLILNVDGVIGALMIDMWSALNHTSEEIDQFISIGVLNAFFILGRSIGFIGHILDEKRLGMPLYRHPTDDILYDVDPADILGNGD